MLDPLCEYLPVVSSEHFIRPQSARLFDLWQQWTLQDAYLGLPHWSNFKPVDFASILSSVVLLQVDNNDTDNAQLVLAGERANLYFPGAVNSPISEMTSLENITHLRHCLKACLDQSQPCYTVNTLTSEGLNPRLYDCLMMPFYCDDTTIKILNFLHFDIEKSELAGNVMGAVSR